MDSTLGVWLSNSSPLKLGAVLVAAMLLAAIAGYAVRGFAPGRSKDDQANLTLSALLGLLALLLGFTFALAVDRYETRRVLVLQEANAIGTAYLRAQLLPEPHRTRVAGLIVDYTDNRMLLAEAQRPDIPPLLDRNNQLLVDIWSATAGAYDATKQFDFSTTFIESINALVDLDAARKAARVARVPTAVFGVLFIYVVLTAGALGYTITSFKGRVHAGTLMFLLAMCLLLIIDIDRPTMGTIREIQDPMQAVQQAIHSEPVGSFDQWRQQPGSGN